MRAFLSQWLSLAHKKFISASRRNNVTRRIGNFTSPKDEKNWWISQAPKKSENPNWKGNFNGPIDRINFKCHCDDRQNAMLNKLKIHKTTKKRQQQMNSNLFKSWRASKMSHQSDHSLIVVGVKGNLGHWHNVCYFLFVCIKTLFTQYQESPSRTAKNMKCAQKN